MPQRTACCTLPSEGSAGAGESRIGRIQARSSSRIMACAAGVGADHPREPMRCERRISKGIPQRLTMVLVCGDTPKCSFGRKCREIEPATGGGPDAGRPAVAELG